MLDENTILIQKDPINFNENIVIDLHSNALRDDYMKLTLQQLHTYT